MIVSLTMSVLEGLFSTVVDPVQARAMIMLLLALVLVFRPKGLFSK